ncbi:YbaB/EbfC family nucleoid-associated protein [Gordonia sp. L191]|uniref:YbaB/EbfC family nucleoid-associated protein n=1 Tax=Gordonia sp. L191 TaxID=2982699 RepID=UPI0024BF9021|nr:YbaB/EbfC family nucleoid-associated protein [Gordonia sp. L191]WHU45003.1 YbaB/EbfC family nucleoid-associated protein [Gordonia sp. L191]
MSGEATVGDSGNSRMIGARWADMLDEVDRQRGEVQRVAEAVAELTATATSPDRAVSVTVDARGVLIELDIAPSAMRRYRGEQLAQLITGLVADADGTLRTHRAQLLTAATTATPALTDIEPSAR